MNINQLNYPPIKPIKDFPTKLIYHIPNNKRKSNIYLFKMFSTEPNNTNTAIMRCVPKTIRINGERVKSLYISYLSVKNRRQGFGTSLLNYAQNLSKKIGCEGRIHLSAKPLDRDEAPHVFYKKYGMNTGDKHYDKILSNFVEKGWNANDEDFGAMLMYYPPIPYKRSLTDRIIGFLKK